MCSQMNLSQLILAKGRRVKALSIPSPVSVLKETLITVVFILMSTCFQCTRGATVIMGLSGGSFFRVLIQGGKEAATVLLWITYRAVFLLHLHKNAGLYGLKSRLSFCHLELAVQLGRSVWFTKVACLGSDNDVTDCWRCINVLMPSLYCLCWALKDKWDFTECILGNFSLSHFVKLFAHLRLIRASCNAVHVRWKL